MTTITVMYSAKHNEIVLMHGKTKVRTMEYLECLEPFMRGYFFSRDFLKAEGFVKIGVL